MRVIDLLYKIANGEEVPKKIKYHFQDDYETFYFDTLYETLANGDTRLNDEIEIIEEVEDKEYEDIEEITYKPRKVQNAINALIRNQKKILERLDNDK